MQNESWDPPAIDSSSSDLPLHLAELMRDLLCWGVMSWSSSSDSESLKERLPLPTEAGEEAGPVALRCWLLPAGVVSPAAKLLKLLRLRVGTAAMAARDMGIRKAAAVAAAAAAAAAAPAPCSAAESNWSSFFMLDGGTATVPAE